MTLPLFLAMQKVKIRSERIRRFAVNISTCTLGIWMSHYLFLGPCYMLVESLPIHTMLKMIVCTILLLSVTWIFVYAVRKSGNIGRWIMGWRREMISFWHFAFYGPWESGIHVLKDGPFWFRERFFGYLPVPLLIRSKFNTSGRLLPAQNDESGKVCLPFFIRLQTFPEIRLHVSDETSKHYRQNE